MGLLDFFWRLVFGDEAATSRTATASSAAGSSSSRSAAHGGASSRAKPKQRVRRKVKLIKLRRRKIAADEKRTPLSELTVQQLPYAFARMGVLGGYLDLCGDGDDALLERLRIPRLQTLPELAEWLGMPLGRLAWLTHRCDDGGRPREESKAHYHFHWMKKKGGGYRLIEAPKPLLKQVQRKILLEILNRIPQHPNVHGFVLDRSIRTNAEQHAGQRVVVKLDLENFYPSVGFSRVVAIFRALGYSREVSIWFGRLTTSAAPITLEFPEGTSKERYINFAPYRRRHLPQGAPTSPALANLSGYGLDVRLSGMAKKFKARYTRYADDLTFSGGQSFLNSLRTFLPLVRQIVRGEQFRLHEQKYKVLRDNQQQRVTGVVVNAGANVPRKEYDRLKAILTNSLTRGPSTQNHGAVEDFCAHLRGRISHVAFLSPRRGEKLWELFRQIDWRG
ncbi:MAG: reverse transcriptase family protein [Planctomycetales bacterium]